jgi:hypothetical protein
MFHGKDDFNVLNDFYYNFKDGSIIFQGITSCYLGFTPCSIIIKNSIEWKGYDYTYENHYNGFKNLMMNSILDLNKKGKKFPIINVELIAAYLSKCGWGMFEVLKVNDDVYEYYVKDGFAVRWGIYDKPICMITCGIIAGLHSYVLKSDFSAKEVECQVMGHERCKFVVSRVQSCNKVVDKVASKVVDK